jgi:aldehyde:ferredoxin oxidoreductase
LYGTTGRILRIDLSVQKVVEEEIDPSLYKLWLGGYGLSTEILYDEIPARIDELAPPNIIGFTTGILTGTGVPNGNNLTVVGKSPLTHTWGEARMGGFFGCELKHAGYDAVFVSGRAAQPVYIHINDGSCEIRKAARFWGMDTYETEDAIRDELDDNQTSIACIGPSGESLSLLSGIISQKGRAAGRSGLGAAMGSKNLKAVAVRGTALPSVHDRDALRQLTKEWLKLTSTDPNFARLAKYGTMQEMISAAYIGDAPTKNWKGAVMVDMPDVEKLAPEIVQNFVSRKFACAYCSVGCGGIVTYQTEDSTSHRIHKPEYETLAAFGTMCLNSDLLSIFKATEICNRFGIDTISVGATIAFAMECYENGIVDQQDTGGLDLTWGNAESVVELTNQIARREGFGSLLADGTRVAALKIGKGADQFAMNVMGQEVPMHDPKLHPGAGTTYVCDATPARHTQGTEWKEETYIPGLKVPAISRKYDATSRERAVAHSIWVKFMHVINGLGVCENPTWYEPSTPKYDDFVNAVTGWNKSMIELLECGERIGCMRQAFNVKHGLMPSQFQLPDRIAGKPPLEHGPLKGITIDIERMAREYFKVMDWDYESGRPSMSRLVELGLHSTAGELYAEVP